MRVAICRSGCKPDRNESASGDLAGIFVSFGERRRDVAGRLVDRLRRDYSEEQLFLDIDGIPAGTEFDAVLDERLRVCDVLLALIGRSGWSAGASGRRRLHDPDDYVRREIAAALQRDDVRVIPLLVSGAEMPRAENSRRPEASGLAPELSAPL